MYTDHNRKSAARRADEDFLRRLSGGELGACPFPKGMPYAGPRPERDARVRTACNGGTEATGVPCNELAPSLAMVYSPRQCWRGLLDPAAGLSAGTIFSELVLPFEGGKNHACKEVKIRRPM